MENINRILYSVLLSALLFTSANAEWKMFDSKEGTYIYNTDTGETFLRMSDSDNNQVFGFVPYANGKNRYSNPAKLLKKMFIETK